MRNERIRIWVEALRSGNYKQGKGHLRADDTYCCLGVACDVFESDDIKIHDAADEELNNAGVEFLGISSEEHNHLIHLNDGHAPFRIMPHTFKEIADYLESLT